MLNDKIHLFTGDNKFSIEKKVKSLISSIENKIVLTYNSLDIENLQNELTYKDLFSDNKVIVLKSNVFKASKDDQDTLCHCLKNVDNSAYFICISDSLTKTSPLYKTIFSKCNLCEISQPKEGGVFDYVKKILEEEKIKIKSEDLKKVIELIGNNASSVLFEVERIYSNNGIINEEIINKEVIRENYDLYHLFNIFCERNPERFQSALDSYLKNGYSAIDVFFFLYREIRSMFVVKVLMDDYKMYDYKAISYKAKMNPFKAKVIMGNVKNFKQQDLIKYIRNLIDIQRKMYNNGYISGEILKISTFEMLS
jgi:DNA polymerase III delta subunit